jgi:hypothetical protein
MQMAPQHNVFHGVHVVKEFDILESSGNTKAGNLIRLLTLELMLFKVYVALIGFVDSIDTIKQSRFSGAVRADNGKDIALLHFKRNTVQRFQATEGNRQIVNLEKRHKRKFSLFTSVFCIW